MSSASRAMKILEALAAAGTPPTQSELLRSVELPKSTLATLLAELRDLGYVGLVDKRYVPGPHLLSLSYRLTHWLGVANELPTGVRPVLERLAEATGETVTFSIEVPGGPDGAGSIVALDYVQSPNPLRYVPGLGEPQPLHRSAAGRVFLAFSGRSAHDLPREQLVQSTPKTLVDPDAIDAELARVRRRGFALNIGETVDGLTAIAAPVLDDDGAAIAAVSILGPSQRLADPGTTVWPLLRRELETLRRRAHPEEEA